MTYLGKIFVIVILAFSLFFLATSVITFSTAENWKDRYQATKKSNDELNGKIANAKAEGEARSKALEDAKAEHKTQAQQLQNQITQLQADVDLQTKAATAAKTDLEVAQQTARASVDEATARAGETNLLREQVRAVQNQANDFKLQQVDLNEQIRVLERELDVAKRNNTDLRENVAAFTSFLQTRGLPTDPARLRDQAGGVVAPAEVEGQVTRVNANNDLVELSIGSDDRLAEGQEYVVFRTGATSEYVGKVRIISTESDKAAARVVSRYLGRKVREGDIVAAKIRPRS